MYKILFNEVTNGQDFTKPTWGLDKRGDWTASNRVCIQSSKYWALLFLPSQKFVKTSQFER